MRFLDNLDPDIRGVLIAQLRNLWTHTSTAIEGNTLTLGETAFVIEQGLTISGKPLKDHQEVVGHARAIDLIYRFLERDPPITEDDLFQLHKALQMETVVDIYKPVGVWKKEPNGTYAVKQDKQVYIEYARPEDVPFLMNDWLTLLNSDNRADLTEEKALKAYVDLHVGFVRVHPFFDGNGRMARLFSNLPVLKSGYPPILIPRQKRKEYIDLLSDYEIASGEAERGKALLPDRHRLGEFEAFCAEAWSGSRELVDQAHAEQQKRARK